MASVEEITERLRKAVSLADAGAWDFAKTVKFDLKEAGLIVVSGREVANEDRVADCTFVLSKDDFEHLARGRLDPVAAMMRGRLKVTGDLTLAMRLKSVLERSVDE